MPEAIQYKMLCDNPTEYMDRVCDNHEPMVIVRGNSRPVILMSLEDYKKIMDELQRLKQQSMTAGMMQSFQQTAK